MNKRRFTPWIVLACMSAVAACTSGEGGTAGNTELNVLVPPDGTQAAGSAATDVQSVEYTINCLGNDDGFLDADQSFPDAVQINGNLEVQDGRTNPGNGPSGLPADYVDPFPGVNLDGQAEVWQAFMDLPPGDCTVQLRARDSGGEVICTAQEDVTIAADTAVKVNLVLICRVSFQAPVGMLDVDATFSFVVGNFCPDLFQLNCLDSAPLVGAIGAPVAATACEVRFRDGDATCGDGCDPQVCTTTAEGLTCGPANPPVDPTTGDQLDAAPNGVRTVVTCDDPNALLDCEGDLSPDPDCVFNGPTTGSVGEGPPVPALFGGTPGPGQFFVACNPAGTPGATITCTARTTDGDEDCDKVTTVDIKCPGLAPCAEPTAPDCTDTSGETHPACVTGVCDDSGGTAVCVFTPIASVPDNTGTDCGTNPGAPSTPGKCDSSLGGICVDFGCTFGDDSTCDTDSNDCTVAVAGDCQADGTCLPNTLLEGGQSCVIGGAGSGGDAGTCETGGICVGLCDGVDCTPTNECQDGSCDPADGLCDFVNDDNNSCTTCTGGGNCECSGGSCIDEVLFNPPAITTTYELGCTAAGQFFGLPTLRTVDPGPETPGGTTNVCFSAGIPLTQAFILAAEEALPGNTFISAEISTGLIPAPLVVPAATFTPSGTPTTDPKVGGATGPDTVSPGPDLTVSCASQGAPAGVCPPDGNGLYLDLLNFPPSGVYLIPFVETCGDYTIPAEGEDYCFNLKGSIESTTETRIGVLARTPSPFVILPANFLCGPADPIGLGTDCEVDSECFGNGPPLNIVCEFDAICLSDDDCFVGTCDLTTNLCNTAGTCEVTEDTVIPAPNFGETCYKVGTGHLCFTDEDCTGGLGTCDTTTNQCQ